MIYTYQEVHRKRGKSNLYVGTLTIDDNFNDPNAKFQFVPSQDENRKYGFAIPSNQVTEIVQGTGPDGNFLVKISYTEENESKFYIFDFKKREAEALKITSLLNKKDLVMNSTATSSNEIPTLSSQSEAKASDYFKDYPTPSFSYIHEPTASSREREIRESLLESDPDLKSKYEASVVSGNVTPEDFWSYRRDIIREVKFTKYQERGLSTHNTSDVRQVGKNNTLTYDFSTEKRDRIFLEQPKVYRLYQTHVENGSMPQDKFWSLYIHSKYYEPNYIYRQRNELAQYKEQEQVKEACKIFGNFNEEDDAHDIHPYATFSVNSLDNRASRTGKLVVDPQVDLLSTLNEATVGASAAELAGVGMANHAGFGMARRDPGEKDKFGEIVTVLQSHGRKATAEMYEKLDQKPIKAFPILTKMNMHGDMVLYDERNHAQRKMQRIKRAIADERQAEALVDLQDAGGARNLPSAIELHITETSNFGSRKDPNGGEPRAKREIQQVEVSGLGNVLPSSEMAVDIVKHILNYESHGAYNTEALLQDIPHRDELLRIFFLSNEIRRSFYAGFPPPPNNEHLQQSLSALVEKMKALELRVRSFRDFQRKNGNPFAAELLLDVIEQVDKALGDWSKWRTMQQNKKQRSK